MIEEQGAKVEKLHKLIKGVLSPFSQIFPLYDYNQLKNIKYEK
jgi:hypothetical protein